MNSESYQRAKTIFLDACDRPQAERAEFVLQACAGDRSLRDAVLQLLAHDDDPLTFGGDSSLRKQLEQFADSSDSGEPDASVMHGDLPNPPTIGRYRLLEVLGRGGMGVVYLAEQENPRRQVALKVVTPGNASRSMQRRFEHEAHILGRLHHPGIAQVYEAGTHDAGHGPQPFFAMELVRGCPLSRWVEQTSAGDLHARLELFIAICDAVQHAHQQGVIHRDLKPANILVVLGQGSRQQVVGSSEGEGSSPEAGGTTAHSLLPTAFPKILDFGVARLTDCDMQVTTMHTAADQIIGTVAYMSPEQLTGRVDLVDSRSDIYALGVILFEMLSGRLPHKIANKTMPETIRIIGLEEPTSLSTINRTYRGDLDTIVSKALERDQSRRYQSVGEFAADLRRYLRHEPIHARAPSTLYQFRKFARRNRAWVGGAACVFLALVGGLITTAWQARQAIAARDEQTILLNKADASARRASVAAAKSTAVNEFLRRMLSSARPESTQGREMSVREVLDAAALEITSGEKPEQRDIEAMIRLTIGETYLSLGRLPEAQLHLEKALELARELHGESSAEVAQILMVLATIHGLKGDFDHAIAMSEQAQSMLREIHPGDHEAVANGLSSLADIYAARGDSARALSLMRESLDMLRRVHGDHSLAVADAQARLAMMLHNPTEAEPLVRAALQTFHDRLGERHPRYITTLRKLAGLLVMRGAFDEAITNYTLAIDLGTVVYGPDHPNILTALESLGFCYQFAGRAPQRLEVCERTLQMARRLYGEDNMRVAGMLMDRGDVRGETGDREGYLADQRAALDIMLRLGEGKDPRAGVARLSVAKELLRQGRDIDEAESLCREVLSMAPALKPESQWMAGQSLCQLGVAASLRGQFAEAETLMLQGFDQLGNGRLTAHLRQSAARHLIRLYDSWNAAEEGAGKEQEALKWRARLEEMTPKSAAPASSPTNPSASGNGN